jgi:hypothetical protein
MSRSAGWLAFALAASLLAGCNFSPAPEATATISPDQVLQTAQAIAEATLAAVTPTVTSTPAPPTGTPILETATPVATATPGSPVLTADYNANVRYGPGEEYPVIDFLLAGQSAAIVGRYDDTPIGTWWLIERPDLGRNGWIWDGAVSVAGSTAGVVVQEKPPTPTPTKGPSKTPGPTSATTAAPTATPTETPTP